MTTPVENALAGKLAGTSAISSLVGARIYPVLLPQDPTYPAITYQRISGERRHDLQGASGIGHPRISVSCWATTYAGVKALAAAVRKALDGFRGTLSSADSPPLTVTALAVMIENEIDLFEPDASADGRRGIHRVVQDYTVTHRET